MNDGASVERRVLDKIRAQGKVSANERDALNQGKYIGAIRNSSLGRWCLLQGETIPVPDFSAEEQRPFVRLMDSIQEAKAVDPNADTEHLEWEIDRLVYDLYGLTEEEDPAVERTLGLIHQTDEEEDAALLKTMLEAEADPKNIADTESRAEFYAITRSWRAEELANETGNQSLL